MKKTKTLPGQLKHKIYSAEKAACFPDTEKQLYDCKQMLEIAKSLCSLLDFSSLIESILYICMCQMRIQGAAMYIHRSADAEFFVLDDSCNALPFNIGGSYVIDIQHPVVLRLNEQVKLYTLDELLTGLEQDTVTEQLVSLNPSVIVPLKQKSSLNGILLLGGRLDGVSRCYSEYEAKQITTLASLAAVTINNAALVEMTTTDTMTRLKLKHFFYTVLADKLEFSVMHKLPLCLIMFDINFFKKVNDTHGHCCGDSVLRQIAKIIFYGIRGQDLAARYGGEEFVVMLFDTDENAGFKVAERIRHTIEEYRFAHDSICLHLTISAGISVFTPDSQNITVHELIDRADQALYQSKRNGRNRVTVFTDFSSPAADDACFFTFGTEF